MKQAVNTTESFASQLSYIKFKNIKFKNIYFEEQQGVRYRLPTLRFERPTLTGNFKH